MNTTKQIAVLVPLVSITLAGVGNTLSSAPAEPLVLRSQNWECLCCYEQQNEFDEWDHGFPKNASADSACNTGSGSGGVERVEVLQARVDERVADNHDHQGSARHFLDSLLVTEEAASGQSFTAITAMELLRGDLEGPNCGATFKSCRGMSQSAPSNPQHSGFHTSLPGRCNAHTSCSEETEQLVAAIDADDANRIATLVMDNPHIYLLNGSRGMVQVLNCARNEVQWQLRTDVDAVTAAMEKLSAASLQKSGFGGR